MHGIIMVRENNNQSSEEPFDGWTPSDDVNDYENPYSGENPEDADRFGIFADEEMVTPVPTDQLHNLCRTHRLLLNFASCVLDKDPEDVDTQEVADFIEEDSEDSEQESE